MSSHPTPAPAPAADFVAANRNPVAIALVALGVLFLGGGVYSFAQAVRSQSPAPSPATEGAEKPAEPVVGLANPHRTEYLSGGVLGVMAGLVGVSLGAWVLARLPRTTEAERRTEARAVMLAAGGLLGLVLMLGGFWFFFLWFGSLTAWLDEGKRAEAKWVLFPLLVFLVGAGLAFVGAQPARAEERNNPNLRRLVYGANFGLTVLLLALLLLVGNVFAALRVPNKLDATSSGFYTLAEPTKEFIATLDKPVTAYSIAWETSDERDRFLQDVRSLLTAMQEVNPAKFRVRYLSPGLNREEINRLSTKHPILDKDARDSLGILLVVGEDESRAGFVKSDDMFTREGMGRGGAAPLVFQGEAKLVKELLTLTDSGSKPIVYFTQSSGELLIDPQADEGGKARRTARDLKAGLEGADAEVRALPAGLTDKTVPADADIVVVADPTQPLPAHQVEALRQFMSAPRANGKKGKLIVLAGAHADRDGKIIPTGLEGLLAGFGVQLGDSFVYRDPRLEIVGVPDSPSVQLGVVTEAAVNAKNPMALVVASYRGGLPFADVRTVTADAAAPGGPFRAERFLATPSRIPTWLEPTQQANPEAAFRQILEADDPNAVAAKKQYSSASRSLAVTVSEGETPRAVVIGTGEFFSDETTRQLRGGLKPQAEFLAAGVSWLRDRPAAAVIANKTYGTFTPNADPSSVRLLFLPVGALLLTIVVLGVGVWVSRQK